MQQFFSPPLVTGVESLLKAQYQVLKPHKSGMHGGQTYLKGCIINREQVDK